MDEGGGGNSASADSRNNIQNPRNVRSAYGLSDFNYAHRLTTSVIYDLPLGRGRRYLGAANRLNDALAGGWQLTSIVTAQSGPPGSLSVATSTSNTGTTQYPNRICNGNLSPSQRDIHHWFDTSCYTVPAAFTFGNSGRNVMIAPGLETWDFGAHKDFRLTEQFGLTYRAEFFNMLNKPNFRYPNTSIGGPTAGTITSVNAARQIQFALRLHW
jgi:hypothetical protein